MAKQNQIIGNDMANLSITTRKMLGISWTIQEFSKIEYDTKVFSPDFYIPISCKCCISVRKYDNKLYLCLCNKSNSKIQIERKVVLYDCYKQKRYAESDGMIFSIEKDNDVNVISDVNRHPYDKLANDTLIIDLCVNIMDTETKDICNIDPEQKLMEDFKSMLENPVNSDVSLQVGEEQIPAHWSILCSRSPYFKRMFDSNMKERVQNSVTITDSSLDTVKMLIRFLYTADFVHRDDLQELFDLYYAADKYEVMDLRALCGYRIISKATAEKACEIFQMFRRHNDTTLKMEVLDFIRAHSDAVLRTEGWNKFEASDPEIAELISFFLKKK